MAVLTSRRLWTFVLAQVVSIISLLIGHYFTDPFALQVAVSVIGFVEGLAGLLIVAFTVDDIKGNAAKAETSRAVQVAAIEAGTHPDFPPVEKP